MKTIHATFLLFLGGWALASCTYIDDNRGTTGTAAPTGDEELLAGLAALKHELWDRTSMRHIGAPGVDYDGLGASAEERYALKKFVEMLAQVDPTGLAGKQEKIAYYVNFYNAVVVHRVIAELEKDAGFRVDQNGFVFFDEPVLHLAGVNTSLNVLEHGVVRGDWDHDGVAAAGLAAEDRATLEALHQDLWTDGTFDPRLHFVLNCASKSCPPLSDTALTAATLETQLDAATEAFLQDPERGAGPQGISMLFDWFVSDFETAGFATPADFIEAYRDLAGVDTSKFLDYDWSLNRWVRP